MASNLIIDIGNTQAKLAVFKDGCLIGNIKYTDNTTLDGLYDFVSLHSDINKAIISSVVKLSCTAQDKLRSLHFPVINLNAHTPLPVSKIYEFPEEMGSDRIAADVAAIKLADGRPVMVFDAGTCLTCELLHPELGLVGGNISPGLQLRLHSMHEHTSALPLITAENTQCELLGTNTQAAMLSGAINSIVFEIEGYVRRLQKKYPNLLVCFTGGDSFIFDKSLKSDIIQDKLLLLRGLNYILDFNEL